MMSNWYYFDTKGSDANTAGAKAPKDIATILKRRGAKAIRRDVGFTKEHGVRRLLHILSCIMNWMISLIMIPAGSTVVLQHPYDVMGFTETAIRIGHRKKIKFVFFIHDIGTLRGIDTAGSAKQERCFLLADYNVAHNDVMKRYLASKGLNPEKILCLQCFDYLVDQAVATYTQTNQTAANTLKNQAEAAHAGLAQRTVIIAGNLDKWKSSYIYKLLASDLKFTVRLYGPYFSGKTGDHVDYRGSFAPEAMPGELTGSFGLVWDGDTLDTCSGTTGRYLRYNHPHKVSLYLAAGIPLLVWKEAAIASFIEEHHVGCCINSLQEIPHIFDTMDEKTYEDMLKNAKELSGKLRTGYFTNAVLDEIMKNEARKSAILCL